MHGYYRGDPTTAQAIALFRQGAGATGASVTLGTRDRLVITYLKVTTSVAARVTTVGGTGNGQVVDDGDYSANGGVAVDLENNPHTCVRATAPTVVTSVGGGNVTVLLRGYVLKD